jgi:hypothetical protein
MARRVSPWPGAQVPDLREARIVGFDAAKVARAPCRILNSAPSTSDLIKSTRVIPASPPRTK